MDFCKPKEYGDLEFRRASNFNLALVSKLTWSFITSPDKNWIHLFPPKYLRGKSVLSVQKCPSGSSWIWASIVYGMNLIKKGMCYKIEENSNLDIWNSPWIPGLEGFKIPSKYHVNGQVSRVQQLLLPGTNVWNNDLVYNLLPPTLAREFLKSNSR